jgi:hypothetical protein
LFFGCLGLRVAFAGLDRLLVRAWRQVLQIPAQMQVAQFRARELR